jgi:hypothetical protein
MTPRSRPRLSAVHRELDRRRREELRRSLRSPHPESADLAEMGIQEWARKLPQEDAAELVDASAGRVVRWVPGQGWIEQNRTDPT